MLIGLAGKMQTGKDTIGNYLRKKYDFSRVASADYLKEVAEKLGWDGKKDKRGRKFLQKLGTECVREYNPDFWINIALKRTIELRDYGTNVAVTDVRFTNEVSAIKKERGVIIGINRDTGIKDSHKSETELDGCKFDYEIDNNGTFKELYSQVDKIMEEIL